MLNIIDLEKRWFRYKIKSFMPYGILIVSFIILSIVGFIFLQNTPKTSVIAVEKKLKKKTKNDVIVEKKNSLKKHQTPVQVKDSTIVKLEPSLGFMKNIQNSSHLYYENDTEKKIIKIKSKQRQLPPKNKKIEELVLPLKIKIPKQAIQVRQEIHIKRKNTQGDINNIIKRFKKNSNPALSLFVAREAYKMGNYNQAYNYALITNNLNNNIDASWIIFAKSLVKLGKKKRAVKTLKEYIKYSNSSNAQILLNAILSGKFR